MNIRALVPTGHGINCEIETRRALEMAGFDQVDLIHLNFLARGEVDISSYHILIFPGGFLDGDDLGAAQACANRLRHSRVNAERFIDHLVRFVEKGGLILGICNGFQLLVKLGLLPASGRDYTRREVTLTGNDRGRFEDRWVYLAVDKSSPCIFLRGVEHLYLPVRHGEGKIVGRSSDLSENLAKSGQAPVRYALPGGLEAHYGVSFQSKRFRVRYCRALRSHRTRLRYDAPSGSFPGQNEPSSMDQGRDAAGRGWFGVIQKCRCIFEERLTSGGALRLLVSSHVSYGEVVPQGGRTIID